jgi:sterol desaturase/sphingolipid hydroxylase (fatty acid hydroxylase superfamily)
MESEAAIRISIFMAVFSAMAAFELWSPKLQRDELRGALKTQRWLTNVGMLVISSVLVRMVFPSAVVGVAIWAEAHQFGLSYQVALPVLVAGIIAFVVLDFAVWLEHVISHRWQWLWRIHRVHHSDTGFDLTTALRFHPLEILLSMVWKALVVAFLGAPVAAVLVFEVVLNGMAMFNHANVALPKPIDMFLRRLVVTPDMHRVHHSQIESETNSNFGFNLSIWDRLAGLYVAAPQKGGTALDIGLAEFDAAKAARLDWALLLPFARRSTHGGR